MSKKLDYEDTKRVSTTKGFLGYKDKTLSIIEHGKGLLSVWKTKRKVGVLKMVDRNGDFVLTTRGI